MTEVCPWYLGMMMNGMTTTTTTTMMYVMWTVCSSSDTCFSDRIWLTQPLPKSTLWHFMIINPRIQTYYDFFNLEITSPIMFVC